MPNTAGMTHNSDRSQKYNPGLIFADIPGALGYHPEECLVAFLFFREDRITPNCSEYSYILGPMIRADIDSIMDDEEYLHQICRFEPDLVFMAAIGSDDAAHAALHFEATCQSYGLPLAGLWHIPELYSGAPYTRIGGESVASLGPVTSGREEWESGYVGDILSAPSMAAFRRRGELPELSREESFAFLAAPNPHVTRRERRTLTKRGKQHAKELLNALRKSEPDEAEYMVDSLLDDIQEVIDYIVAQQLTPDEICSDLDLIEQCVVYFSHTSLRDPMFHWAISEYAQAFFSLCVAMARSTAFETRSNALCCAALAASFTGQEHRVNQALQLAFESNRKHRLTLLMMEALHCGGLELLYQACHEGSDLARKALLKN